MRRATLHFIAVLFCGLASLPGGCVTAHEADVKLLIRGEDGGGELEECLLLSIRSESLDRQGHWWVAQDESSGRMVPQLATLRQVDSGEMLHQGGKVVMLLGPYVRSHTIGWEYWLIYPGRQPDDFFDEHVERTYQRGKPLEIVLLKVLPGRGSSDEKVIDAARRIDGVFDLLPADSDLTARLVELILRQLRDVVKFTFKTKVRRQALELIKNMESHRRKIPADLPEPHTPAMGEKPK